MFSSLLGATQYLRKQVFLFALDPFTGFKFTPGVWGRIHIFKMADFYEEVAQPYYFNYLHCKSILKHCFTFLLNTFGTQIYKQVITVRLNIVYKIEPVL